MVTRILLSTTVHWPSTARLASAFAAVGAQVDALYPAGHVNAKSRFVCGRYLYNPLLPLPSLALAIEESSPGSYRSVRRPRGSASAVAPPPVTPNSDVGSLIAFSLGRIEDYPEMFSRSRFIAAALREGRVAAPHTLDVEDGDALDLALLETGLPAVLKSDGSWGGGGVVIVRTQEQAHKAFARLSAAPSRLRSVARTFRRRDAHFLLDALSPAQRRSAFRPISQANPATTSIACWQGRVLASIHMDVLETSGPTGPASVMRRVDCPQMEEHRASPCRALWAFGFARA